VNSFLLQSEAIKLTLCAWIEGLLSHNFALADVPALVDRPSRKTLIDTAVDNKLRAQPPHATLPETAITIEAASTARLANLQGHWQDLITRADSANIFMNPALLRLADESYPDRRCRILLAWQDGPAPRLVGIWGFAVARAPRSVVPLSVLIAPPMPNGYLSTPVIDRDCLDNVLSAMLDYLAADESLPAIVALDAMDAGTPTMQALSRVLERGGNPLRIFTQWMRPALASNLDGKAYLEKALSSSSRKKLRQHRRRLSEKGLLHSAVLTEQGAVRNAFEEFLSLEAAGWKGRQGTALLNRPPDACFARAMIEALSARGDAAIHMLALDERPVSMQVVLHSGPAAFTWKTAYAEAFHDFSPGMLLWEDYTAALLADRRTAYVDSCAFDDNGYMAAWIERTSIAELWFDVRRGRSWTFSMMAQVQGNCLALRQRLKAIRHGYTRRTTQTRK